MRLTSAPAENPLTVGDTVALTESAISLLSKSRQVPAVHLRRLRGKIVGVADGSDPSQRVGIFYVQWDGSQRPWDIDPTAIRRIKLRRAPMPYREALEWLTKNDDTDWLHADGVDVANAPSVTACLIADIYGRTIEEVTTDLTKMLGIFEPEG